MEPYFFGCKTEFFSFCFQKNPRNLDPSYDGSRLLGFFGKGKLYLDAEFPKPDLEILEKILRDGKTEFYRCMNMVVLLPPSVMKKNVLRHL